MVVPESDYRQFAQIDYVHSRNHYKSNHRISTSIHVCEDWRVKRNVIIVAKSASTKPFFCNCLICLKFRKFEYFHSDVVSEKRFSHSRHTYDARIAEAKALRMDGRHNIWHAPHMSYCSAWPTISYHIAEFVSDSLYHINTLKRQFAQYEALSQSSSGNNKAKRIIRYILL